MRPPCTQQEIDESEGTLSVNTWSKGRVNWADFVDVTSMPSSSTAAGKEPDEPEDEDSAEASDSGSDEDDDEASE